MQDGVGADLIKIAGALLNKMFKSVCGDIEVDQPVITPTKTVDAGPVVANFENMSQLTTTNPTSQPPHELDHEVDELVTITEATDKAPIGLITPEAIRPYPKAAPRTGRKGRKKGSSRILTDTPEKQAIEAAYLDRIKCKPSIVPLSKRGKSTAKNTSTKTKKKKTSRGDQSNSESDGNISLHDDSDMDASDSLSSSEFDAQIAEGESIQYLRNKDLNENDYVLVKCHSTKNDAQMYFVAIIKRKDESMFLVSFMKKKFGYKFLFPDKEDQSFIPITDIVKKLPKPRPTGGTSRTAALFTFKFNFSKFKLG